ncbi:MAG TPA: hypothetical protein VIU62_13595 [Chloroflexota bacterium]|jgi:hypothetical protein
MHEHSWYFTFAPARWTATCPCGLAVTVEERAPGKQSWEWTLNGAPPPAAVMLDGLASVTRARGELLATRAPGWN